MGKSVFGCKMIKLELHLTMLPGSVSQSVTCLTADPEIAGWIPTQSHTFEEIDHEIISMAILLPSADSRRVVVSESMCTKCQFVNHLVKLVQE